MYCVKFRCPHCYTESEVGFPQTSVRLVILEFNIECSVCGYHGAIDRGDYNEGVWEPQSHPKYSTPTEDWWRECVGTIVNTMSGYKLEWWDAEFRKLNIPYHHSQYVEQLLADYYWYERSPHDTAMKFFQYLDQYVNMILRSETPETLGEDGLKSLRWMLDILNDNNLR